MDKLIHAGHKATCSDNQQVDCEHEATYSDNQQVGGEPEATCSDNQQVDGEQEATCSDNQQVDGEHDATCSDNQQVSDGHEATCSDNQPASGYEVDMETDDSDNGLKTALLSRVAQSDGHFKHQQRGEPDLSFSEKLEIASDILERNPAVFLSRYGEFLQPQHLAYFDSLSEDYTINFHLNVIKQSRHDRQNQTLVRNRRYQAMQEMMAEGEYFSEDSMKSRDPLLYDQLVGRYLTEEDIQGQIDKSDLAFSSILLKHIQVIQDNELYTRQKDLEDGQEEEEDEDESEESEMEDEEEDSKEEKLPDAERLMLRQEFLHTMQQRFLNGKDAEFNYSAVDGNVNYDSLELLSHDAEDRYFDDEEPLS